MIRHRRHWALHLLMICALAAVVTRALVPVGYMATTVESGLTITLCGSGQSASIDLDDDHPKPAPGKGVVCAFAIAASGLSPPEAAALAAPHDAPMALEIVSFDAARVGQGLAAPPPPARGPPRLA